MKELMVIYTYKGDGLGDDSKNINLFFGH